MVTRVTRVTRVTMGDEGPAPDCRLNATLVVANIAGDVEGRRMILGSVDDGASAALVAGLAEMLVGRNADRAMLAAYSMGELARPLRLDGDDPGMYPREMGDDGQSPVSLDEEFIRDSSATVAVRAARADDGFLGAQLGGVDRAFDQMPNHPLRDQVREMLRTSAANARSAAVASWAARIFGGGSKRATRAPRMNRGIPTRGAKSRRRRRLDARGAPGTTRSARSFATWT